MPDTAIERDFAGGRFTFYLNLPAVLAVEKGPVTPALRLREYPVSLFQIYDELAAGIRLGENGQLIRAPGGFIFAGDIHNILERALIGGKSGTKDGISFEVDGRTAAQLVNDFLMREYEACALLAWDILHSTIKGIDLKKKAVAAAKPRKRPRSAAAK